jgi:hypothetical protein
VERETFDKDRIIASLRADKDERGRASVEAQIELTSTTLDLEDKLKTERAKVSALTSELAKSGPGGSSGGRGSRSGSCSSGGGGDIDMNTGVDEIRDEIARLELLFTAMQTSAQQPGAAAASSLLPSAVAAASLGLHADNGNGNGDGDSGDGGCALTTPKKHARLLMRTQLEDVAIVARQAALQSQHELEQVRDELERVRAGEATIQNQLDDACAELELEREAMLLPVTHHDLYCG